MNDECGMMNGFWVLGVRCWVVFYQHPAPNTQHPLSFITHHSAFIIFLSPSPASVFFRAVDGEVCIGVDARLVELDHLRALGLGEFAALDALRDEASEALVQLAALVARAVERLADGRASDDLLYQVAVLVDVYVRLVWSAEEVVVVAHHLLV